MRSHDPIERRLPLFSQTENDGIDWELQHHLLETADRLVEEGWTPDAARAEAERRFGSVAGRKQELKKIGRTTTGGDGMMEWFAGEVRGWTGAARRLVRSPGPTGVIVGSLALAMATALTTWAVVYGIMLEPAPYADPGGIVEVDASDEPERYWTRYLGPATAGSWSEAGLFTHAGLHSSFDVARTDRGQAESVSIRGLTAGAEAALGVEPVRGRAFAAEEFARSAPVAIATWDYAVRLEREGWSLGDPITIDEIEVAVIGVMPRDFRFPMRFGAPLFVPMSDALEALGRTGRYGELVARIPEGRTIESVQTQADELRPVLVERLDNAKLAWIKLNSIERRYWSRGVRSALILVGLAVAALVLIAIANASLLTSIRAADRRRETQVMRALGASRGTLLVRWWREAALLGLAAIVAATLATQGMLGLVPSLLPRSVAFMAPNRFVLDPRVLAMGLAAIGVFTAALSVVPAFFLSGDRLVGGATGDRRHSDGRGARRLRSGLLSAQVALSFVLLIGATLVLRSYVGLNATDVGYDVDHTASLMIDPTPARYPDPESQRVLMSRILRELEAIPGVDAVAPTIAGISFGYDLLDSNGESMGLEPDIVPYLEVYDDGPNAMGVRLVAGRWFEPGDAGSNGIIIDRAWADLAFGSAESAVGAYGPLWAEGDPVRIVGVADDLRLESPDDRSGRFDRVLAASRDERVITSLAIRVAPGVPVPIAEIREAVGRVDPAQPIGQLRTGRDALADDLSTDRFLSWMLASLAAMALMLALIGLQAGAAYGVQQRRREIGIRLAIGAEPGAVRRGVLRQTGAVAALGVVIGALIAFRATGTIAENLYGIDARDPLTFAAVPILLVGASLLGALGPALRATRVDPARVLREE